MFWQDLVEMRAKAAANLKLSPAERATLKLVEGFLDAGWVAAMGVVASGLVTLGGHFTSATGQPDIHSVYLSLYGTGVAAAGAFLHGCIGAARKYTAARGDVLGDAASALLDQANAVVPAPPPSNDPSLVGPVEPGQ